MKHGLLLILTVLPLLGVAADLPPSTPAALQNSRLPAAVIESTRNFTLKMKVGATIHFCSSFAVTPEGYILTALHCVRPCLKAQSAIEESANSYMGLTDLGVVRDPIPQNFFCPNLSFAEADPSAGVQIIAVGSALSLFTAEFRFDHENFYNELRERGWQSRANDFALIKIKPLENLKCAKLGVNKPAPYSPLWSVGFVPMDAPARGDELRAHEGLLYAGAEESSSYQAQKTAMGRAWTKEAFGDPELLLSSSPNEGGQSGGPVIGADGKVYGIVSGHLLTPLKRSEPKRELVAVTIGAVLRRLPEALASDLLARNHSGCD